MPNTPSLTVLLTRALPRPQFHRLLLSTAPERVLLPNLVVLPDKAAASIRVCPLLFCHRQRYDICLLQLDVVPYGNRHTVKPSRLIISVERAASVPAAVVSRILLVL